MAVKKLIEVWDGINLVDENINFLKQKTKQVVAQKAANVVAGAIPQPNRDQQEGVIDLIKKGAKRHSKAVEKKKIKNRKAVPYAALAAQHEPEGEYLRTEAQTRYYKDDDRRSARKPTFHDFYKKAKAAKAKKRSEAVRSDSKKHGIKFTDAKGSGRMRGGRKYYD